MYWDYSNLTEEDVRRITMDLIRERFKDRIKVYEIDLDKLIRSGKAKTYTEKVILEEYKWVFKQLWGTVVSTREAIEVINKYRRLNNADAFMYQTSDAPQKELYDAFFTILSSVGYIDPWSHVIYSLEDEIKESMLKKAGIKKLIFKRFRGGLWLFIVVPINGIVRSHKGIAGHVIGKGGRMCKKYGYKVEVID